MLAIRAVEKRGYKRSVCLTPSLRRAGVHIEMVMFPCNGRFRWTPWAPKWAIDLGWKLRGLKVHPKDRTAVFKEAGRLGKPGPLARSVIVAGRMMG
jgi:hypothetical protein